MKPIRVPEFDHTVGVPDAVICALPPVAWKYANGRPCPTVAFSVRVPSDQYGVTVQSLQPSTLTSGEFRPATPTRAAT